MWEWDKKVVQNENKIMLYKQRYRTNRSMQEGGDIVSVLE